MRLFVVRLIPTAAAFILASIALTGPAKAQLFLITSRPLLVGSDFIDWANAGPNLSSPSNPFSINSFDGNVTTVSETGGTFYRYNQSNPFNGNFAPGDALLDSGGFPGTMMLSFATPVSAAGAQIQSDFFGPFTAQIEAYDSGDSLLGFLTENGTSNNNADNSAIFIGVGSGSANIKRIGFSLTSVAGNPGDFAINRVDLTGGETTALAPEGSSLALMAGGALPFLFMAARRFRRSHII